MALATNLQIAAFMSGALRGFQSAILPLYGFSMTFRRDPLERRGDDMIVEYVPADSAASKDFTSSYDFTSAGPDNEGRKITVNKRKYKPIKLTSAELARYNFTPEALGFQRGRKLGLDVVADVLSLVTAANYPGVALTSLASAFDSDDVADIKLVCDQAEMPRDGRSLVMDAAYDTALLKDAEVKAAYSYGDDMPMKEGRIMRLMGFDVTGDNNIPSNDENLVGFAAYKSAVLVGFSPVEPAESVRQSLADYRIEEDPQTGLVLERRLWGDPDTDQHREVIECNYGYEVGEASALHRLRSAA